MRKLFFILCVVMMSATCFAFAGCTAEKPAEVEKYYLNERDYLVAEYEDGSKEELTTFEEILLNSNFEVKISSDGYYIINGISTNILARYTVQYKVDGNFDVTVKPEKVIKGEVAHQPHVQIDGYELKGWFDGNGKEWNFNNPVTTDLTLTAQFEAKTYAITLINDNDVDEMGVIFGEEYTLPTLTKTGYTFKGWYKGTELVDSEKWNIPENCTLLARWDADKYSITFDNDGHGQALEDKEVTYDEGYSLTDLTQTGYTFNGWYLDGVEFDDSGVWKLTEDITLKAGWTANEYTVSFTTKYGTAPDSMTVTFGQKETAPEFVHEQLGYTFNGWKNGSAVVDWSENWSIAKDCTLSANWTANTYTITYKSERGTTSKVESVTFDKTYTVLANSEKGYNFLGWFEEGSEDALASGTWTRDESITVTAKWQAKTYDVTLIAYDATFEGGEEIEGGQKAVIKVTYDTEVVFPEATMGKKQFKGWYDGVGDDATQVAGRDGIVAKWNIDKQDITLYAKFQDVIILENVNDLKKLQNEEYYDCSFVVVNNIDASSLGEWKPVGTKENPFKGSIDGNGKTISGVKISSLIDGVDSYGFLGYTVNAKIENLKLDVNINLPAIISDSYVGGLIGYSMSASVSGVSVSGSVKLAKHSTDVKGYVAGIVGYANIDTIKNCVNSAEVAGQTVAGGVVGYKAKTQNNIHFEGNQNSGKVSAWIAGGIIGDGVFAFAYKCKNTGEVNGKYYAGGIIGRSDVLVIVEQCVNTAAITTNSTIANRYDAAGGIVGYVSRENGYPYAKASLVANSYNTGKVNGSFNAGGIIGATCYPMQEVKNCYNVGEIIGAQYVGGIVGLNEGIIITQSFNAGAINGKEYALNSTITYSNGTVYDVYIEHCYYNCSISNVYGVGGTATEEKFSEKFYEEDMFWNMSVKVWNFSTDKMPTLAWEK